LGDEEVDMPKVREFGRQLAFKLSPEMDTFLKQMSARLGVSQGWVAREALRRFMVEATTSSNSTDITRIVRTDGDAA
jgi:predicted DNA-binding protein